MDTLWAGESMSRKTAKADLTPVRQRTQYTCMSTSMMMCLRALGHECDEDEVNKVMGARPMKGAAWEQALACAQHYGCRATLTSPSTVNQLKEWTDAGKPVMIAWNPEGREWSHASVVFDVDDDMNVYVADPNIPDPDETVRVVPKGEFYKKWYEKWPNYLVRRPAMMIDREITADGRQVMASARRVASRNAIRWKPLFDGFGKKYITDDLRVYVSPENTWETVRDRDIPDLHEVADPEMLADGIPELVDAYEDAARDYEKWVRQGWWPRPEKVQKWRIYVTHRPTKKNFESKGLYDSEREALRMAEIAIPKVQARRRPRWLVPDSDNEAATMRSAKHNTLEGSLVMAALKKAGRVISDDDFDDDYEPIDSPSGETYWEANEIRGQKDKNIWTAVEGDDGITVIPGFHRVNAIGYMVTKKPWRSKSLEVRWASAGRHAPAQEDTAMKSAKRSKRKRPTEVRTDKKDPNKVRGKAPSRRNPHALDALLNRPAGPSDKRKQRTKRKKQVPRGNTKHKKDLRRERYASAARVATMFMLKGEE